MNEWQRSGDKLLNLNRGYSESRVQDKVKLRVKLKVNHVPNMDTSAQLANKLVGGHCTYS